MSFFSRFLSQPAAAAPAATANPPAPASNAAAPAPAVNPAAGATTEPPAADVHEQNAAIVAFDQLRTQLATANGAVAALTRERDSLASQLSALTTERDQLRAENDRTRSAVTADVRNQELAHLAASQGIPAGQTPAAGAQAAAGDQVSSFREKLDSLQSPIARAEHILKALNFSGAAAA